AVAPALPGPSEGLMLHLCLAVLTGLVFLAGLGLAWRRHHSGARAWPPGAAVGEQSTRQRVPPTPLRLARLGVLRL
ncbi:MAG: hypothetical protein ACRDS0_41235, partial [Pseudonocardiaceae bacterium]